MAEETTESINTTVAKTSDGTVKITVEKYEELTRRANEPKVTNYNPTIVEKTAEQRAQDLIAFGGFGIGLGVTLSVISGFALAKGLRDLKALKG